MTKQKLIILLVLYLVSTGLVYAFSSQMAKGKGVAQTQQATPTQTQQHLTADESDTGKKLLNISAQEPRNQQCPINGQLFTVTEKAAWEKRRPLAVMIENSPDARPQSGLTHADLVFEALAEGGVTRFMGIFYCDVQAEDTTLAPIRSARTYFVDWASGFNLPLYAHVGGANLPGPADALGQIGDYGWNGQNDMNEFSIGYPTFVRNDNRIPGKSVATEHTMETSTEKLWAIALKRNWTNLSPARTLGKKTTTGADWKDGYTPWSFQDDKAVSSPTASTISFQFWDGTTFSSYGVRWQYDSATNSYKRFLAGEPHIDQNNKKQIMAKNAVILFTDEKNAIDEKKHQLYRTTGTGDALVFQNGEVVKAKWFKKDREGQLTFKDLKGKDISFVRGLTWISTVANKTTITYQ